MPRFVSPDLDPDDPHSDPVVGLFASCGLEHAWSLGRLARAAINQPSGEIEEGTEFLLEHVANELKPFARGSLDVTVLRAGLIFIESINRVVRWNPDPTALRNRLVAHIAQGERDLNDPVRAVFADNNGTVRLKDSGLIGALVTAGLVDPERFLSADAIRNTGKYVSGSAKEAAHEGDPRLPEYWCQILPERTVVACEVLLRDESIEGLGSLAWGIERCLSLRYRSESEHLYPLFPRIAQLLCDRRHRESAGEDLLLTKCCWTFGTIFREATAEIFGDHYKPLRELALAEWGRVRSWLRSESAADQLEREQDYLHAGAFFVLRSDSSSLWDVLRRMLLAFRELPQRSIPLDVRTWDEHGLDRLPQPWGWLPTQISNVLELLLGRELERDVGLAELRRDFARFCSDRLKTKKKIRNDEAVTVDALVEPDENWRIGYIHAVRELHAQLGERGHHVLGWSARHDPSEAVRHEAKKVHNAVRRSHGLPADASPRRAVFSAFWWLRQAHVLAHGDKLERDGVLRTLRKEMRRQASERP